jgi:predicted nucleic acid-binding protein
VDNNAVATEGRIRRIYTDTSIFGGLFEPEFQHGSAELLRHFNAGRLELVLSDIVVEELAGAPQYVRDVVVEVAATAITLSRSLEAETLQEDYLSHDVLPRKCAVDALHVALATVAQCDAIVSWNFRHIVNDRRIPLFNAVNTLRRYDSIGIFTPHAVIGDVDAD